MPQLLINLFPAFMKLILLAIFTLLIFNFRFIISAFKGIKRKAWVALLAVIVLGLAVRLFIIPHTHQVYFDEFDHINVAENILFADKFSGCAAGTFDHCQSYNLIPWLPGYHTFLSLIFSLFGNSEGVAFNTNAVIGSLSIGLVFLLVFLVYKDLRLGLVASFLFSFIPVHLKFSGTNSLEILSLFFLLLAMILFELYAQKRKFSLFLLFLAVVLYTLHIRPENSLLILFFPVYWWFKPRHEPVKVFTSRDFIALFIFLVALCPLAILLFRINSTFDAIGWNEPFLTKLLNIKSNFVPNLRFFIDPAFNSIIFFIFCLSGSLRLYFNARRQLWVYTLFFLLFFFTYSSYMNGNLLRGDSSRYSLILYIPLIFIAVNGIKFILEKVRINKGILIFLIVIIFLASLAPAKKFVFAKNEQNGFSSEYEFILSMADKLPGQTYIISYSTSAIISSIHKKAIMPDEFMRQKNILATAKNLILFKDFWWQKNFRESARLEEVLKKEYDFQLLGSRGNCEFYNLSLKQS